MFSPRFFHLFLLALAIAYVAQAGVPQNYNGLRVRQDDSTDAESTTDIPTSVEESVTSQPAETTTEAAPETTTTEAAPTTSAAETTQQTSEAAVTTTTEDVTSQPEETTTAPAPTTAPASPTSQAENESTAASTTEEAPETTSATQSEDNNSSESSKTSVKPIVSTSFEVITKTNSQGNVEVTTSASVSTTTPDLNEDDGNGSGLSKNTRNIVIGVVVGVGGAIILGALGVVAWRIRARKKLAEENDGLMDYDGGYNNNNDKSEPTVPSTAASGAPTSSTRSPFQSTLDTYHQPSQPVNASSNF